MPSPSTCLKKLKSLAPVLLALPFPVSLTDARNHFVFVNSAFERKYGHTLAALQGKDIGVLMPRDAAGAGKTSLGELLQHAHHGGWSGRLVNVTRRGKHIRVGMRILALHAPSCEPHLLWIGCEAGSEEPRDSAIIGMLLNRFITLEPLKAAAQAAMIETLLARAPMRRKVFDLLMEGHSYKEISHRLNIADATVRVVAAGLRKELGEELVPRLKRAAHAPRDKPQMLKQQ